MFVDASALTAILAGESDAAELLARMQAHSVRRTSPLAVWETSVALARILALDIAAAAEAVEQFLALASIAVVDVPAETRLAAIEVFARYGKGRHLAALNFGDCFAYALARHLRAPMLYKGDDFAQTDVEPA